MNEINRLASFTVRNASIKKDKSTNNEVEKQDKNFVNENEYKQSSAQDILDSMHLMGQMNAFNINKTINPADYLTPDRIADIEASMAIFESGVQEHASALKNEFANVSEYDNMNETDKLALAAHSFASM